MLKIGLVIMLLSSWVTAHITHHCSEEIVEEGLWDRYSVTHHQTDYDALVNFYLPWVEDVVDAYIQKSGFSYDRDNLITYGCDGLKDAILKFERERKLKFKTYAQRRVKGAVIDGIRKEDFAPRTVRIKQKVWDQAVETLMKRLGKYPSSEQIRIYLGLTDEQFREWGIALNKTHRVELDGQKFNRSSGKAVLWKDDLRAGASEVSLNQLREEFEPYLKLLPSQEGQVIEGYFIRGITLREIGLEMGLTESRVSQLKTAALAELRRHSELTDFITSK
jgi:RNA polymerase sigma factor for flagellar operon FliA